MANSSALSAGKRVAVGRREAVLAVERAAVGRKLQRAVMDHGEVVGIAVVRGGQDRRRRSMSSRVTRTSRGPPTIGRAEQQPPQIGGIRGNGTTTRR